MAACGKVPRRLPASLRVKMPCHRAWPPNHTIQAAPSLIGGLSSPPKGGVAAREQQDVVKEGPELAARLVDGERNGVPGARHRLEPLHHAKGGGRVEA